MFSYLRYLAIHKEMAQKHKMLNHVDGSRMAFYGDNAEEDKQGVRTKGPFVMAMLPVQGKLEGSDDMVRNVMTGGFELSGKIEPESKIDYRKREEMYDKAMEIAVNCVMRLHAMSMGDLCTDDGEDCGCVLNAFDINSVEYNKIELDGGYYGWRVTYKMGDGETMEHDATAWND